MLFSDQSNFITANITTSATSTTPTLPPPLPIDFQSSNIASSSSGPSNTPTLLPALPINSDIQSPNITSSFITPGLLPPFPTESNLGSPTIASSSSIPWSPSQVLNLEKFQATPLCSPTQQPQNSPFSSFNLTSDILLPPLELLAKQDEVENTLEGMLLKILTFVKSKYNFSI